MNYSKAVKLINLLKTMPLKHNNTGFTTVDAAETAFYKAFAKCDHQAMDAVWADAEVVCIHPGSAAIVGREAVLRSWKNILTQAEPPDLHIEVLSRTEKENMAVHLVEEHIKSATDITEVAAVVLATNIYCLQADGWHLLEHHGSIAGPRKTTH